MTVFGWFDYLGLINCLLTAPLFTPLIQHYLSRYQLFNIGLTLA